MAHSPARVVLMVITCLIFIAHIVFTYFAYNQKIPGLFRNETDLLREGFYLEVAPSPWTFYVWFPVWIWQFAWLLYCLTTTCRASEEGIYLYTFPVVHPTIFISLLLQNILMSVSLYLWDRLLIGWATLAFGFGPIVTTLGLFFSYRKLYQHLETLGKAGMKADVWLTRVLVQNGLAILIGWGLIDTCFQGAMVMTYQLKIRQDYSSTTALGVVSFFYVLWFALDCTVFDKFSRYTFSPYPVLIVTCVGSVVKNYNLHSSLRNSIFLVTLLAASVAMLITKAILMIYLHRRRPIENKRRYDVNFVSV